MHVRKPIKRGSTWVVVICESISPLSKKIEEIPCFGREDAWQTYRRILKEQGKML